MTSFRKSGGVQPRLGGFLPLFAFLIAVGWAGPSQAQPKDGQVFEDWGIRCLSDPQNAQVQVCRAQHAAVNNQTKKTVMAINVGYPPDGSPARAVILVPLVVLLQPGLKLQVDNGEPMTFPFEVCKPTGCEAHIKLDQAVYSSFSKGTAGTVTVQVPPGRAFSLPFSLKGFTSALKSLK